MRVVASFLAVALAFAGCLGGSSSAPNSPATALVDDAGVALGAENATLNESLVLRPAIDAFADATELMLFEFSEEASITCSSPGGMEFWGGCAYPPWPDGVLVPEGTKALRIEADASGAQRQGSWNVFLDRTYGATWSYGNKTLEGEPTRDAAHTWTLPLQPSDWDYPTHEASRFILSFYGYGEAVNVLHGPVRAKVFAERDPAWVPLPVLDVWRMPTEHRIPQDGVVTLLDVNMTLDCPANDSCTPFPALQDKVPEGATKLVFAVAHGPMQGCPSGDSCHVRTPMASGSRYTTIGLAKQDELGPGFRVIVYDVPEQAGEDNPYVAVSATRFYPWIDDCPPGQASNPNTCTASATVGVKTDARFIVEAWQGDVDVEAVKARLGAA